MTTLPQRMLSVLFCMAVVMPMTAQRMLTDTPEASHWAEADDTTKTVDVPIGLTVWTVDARFADTRLCQPDTLPHGFQNDAFTEGRTGSWNTTGNLGAPRWSRLFHPQLMSKPFDSRFFFAQPYDFFLTPVENFRFTNTRSPFTNLTYHECGNKQNGEDRITAHFATNVNKRLGLGFKLDYLYGRGYYEDQSTAHFNGTLYASYWGERYQLHALYTANHLKNTENGGLEDDAYITHPESFPNKYGTADMPVLLHKTWNKLNVNTLFLSHRYNFGVHRIPSPDKEHMQTPAQGNKWMEKLLAANTPDSTALPTDTATQAASVFVPVARLLHTFRWDHNNRRFLCNDPQNASSPDTYFSDFFLPGDSANDLTRHTHLANTIAVEVCEGFNPWAQAGARVYARHDLDQYTLPLSPTATSRYTENHVTLGLQLMRTQGRLFRFNLLGEFRTTGSKWGEFNMEATGNFSIPLRSDTLHIRLQGFVRNEEPSWLLRHYHSRNAWWDHDGWNKVFTTNASATLAYRSTRLSFHFATIQNHTYLQETVTIPTPLNYPNAYRHGVTAAQNHGNLSMVGLTLQQDFKWGILHWDNELTGQLSSDQSIMPLPAFTGYTNLYLLFRIARVLQTELGADLRYFTPYYAPTYSPIIGTYCLQDEAVKRKVGNYPIVNAYLNFHLKNTRFYLMASHVNAGIDGGYAFLVPHYPMNRLVIRFGISWNFFN